MGTRNRESETGCQIVLAVLVTVAFIAGLPPLIEVVAQSLAQSKLDAARAAFSCRVCGVVEDVREVTLGALKYSVSTVSGEGIAIALGLLSGKLGANPVKIYEVAVRLEDGSTRVLRQSTPPDWKPGDHVKVVMGRIKPVS